MILWYSKIKCGAFAGCCFGSYGSAMFFNDTLYQGKANPGALKILGAVQTLKSPELSVVMFHVKSCAVVFKIKSYLAICFFTPYFYHRFLNLR